VRRALRRQPRIPVFREYSFLNEKGPQNAGFSHRQWSLETNIEIFGPKIPKSLQPNPRKFPFSGDSPWRPNNNSTACWGVASDLLLCASDSEFLARTLCGAVIGGLAMEPIEPLLMLMGASSWCQPSPVCSRVNSGYRPPRAAARTTIAKIAKRAKPRLPFSERRCSPADHGPVFVGCERRGRAYC
jgi:hypothetical protein